MFAICSTGRSGSRYISELLSQSGIPCTHESLFTPDGIGRCDGEGDSSWMALPYLEAGYTVGSVLHQARCPLKVAGSYFGLRFFDNTKNGENPWVEFAKRHFDFSGHEIEVCLRWWVEWNQRIERLDPDYMYRVEDLDLEEIAEVLGHDLNDDWQRVYQGLKDMKINSTGPRVLRWADIPDGAVKETAMRMAERYGYASED